MKTSNTPHPPNPAATPSAPPATTDRSASPSLTAVSLYTFSFVFFVGISGYAMAVAAVGWEGGLFMMEPQLSWPKIIVSYAFLFGLNVTLFTLGGLSFQTRDFKT